ncbi:hypothetical protein HDU87_001245 [Geranomyces variabilis]|uniref:Uncharacterized protein n=1 Tax=Geranomyces variabilis TaxID=109894 RepID=A0AAD5XLD0_9FUNG|nr:hypothetical protein HDU87_001245 [Geranomyces variabilis]
MMSYRQLKDIPEEYRSRIQAIQELKLDVVDDEEKEDWVKFEANRVAEAERLKKSDWFKAPSSQLEEIAFEILNTTDDKRREELRKKIFELFPTYKLS